MNRRIDAYFKVDSGDEMKKKITVFEQRINEENIYRPKINNLTIQNKK